MVTFWIEESRVEDHALATLNCFYFACIQRTKTCIGRFSLLCYWLEMTSIDVLLFIYYSRNKARETIINFQTYTSWPKKFNMTFLDNVSAQYIRK